MAVAVHLDNVSKSFGKTNALEEICATIQTGELTGLVGPDGAGKTTLMRIIAGLMVPSGGISAVGGVGKLNGFDGLEGVIGYMPQRFGLYEDLSVIENLRLYADLKNIEPGEQESMFEALLDFTRLGAFTKRPAGKLSGGMKQKLGLACALMGQPRLLLLDEPSVGVDPISRRELWSMVNALAGDGMAIIWSTAYLDEAEQCDSVLLLDRGKLLYSGKPSALTQRLEGRSFLVKGVSCDRRALLTDFLDQPLVRDGVIQGEQIRLVLADAQSKEDVSDFLAPYDGTLDSAEPRFEDAFIDTLGGSPGGRSPIAERMPRVETDRSIMVECKNLTKNFGAFTATSNVSFSVRRGEVFGLLGPNGAGKSTTFRMLCGLLTPTSGSAEVVGLDLCRSPGDAKQQLGYMAQKFSLYGLLSVRQNLEFFSGAYGLNGAEQRRRIDEMVETFDLAGLLNQSPEQLPLGYKQRLALACALMHRPSVLFLDEPTSGVDPLTRREFWSHITGLVGQGVTVLVTTHFMDEAEYCDRVALIHRSRLIALDSTDSLKASVADNALTNPTMEDAFIRLVERSESATNQVWAA